jgi:predicted RNA-binding Zn-ribbon protein involved in translation (DUF1610 family)
MRFIDYMLSVLLASGLGVVLYLMTSSSPTVEEVTLLSVLLALLSILAAWLVTHIYSRLEKDREITRVQEVHQANLRMYALKAAEKVNNLSNELARLAVYLEEELENEDLDAPQTVLQRRDSRIASAIHLVNTLKSMNDTGLSDWEGVIGDELDKQREAREEQLEQLEELTDRLQHLYEPLLDGVVSSQARSEEVRREVAAIRRELRTAMTLSSVPIGSTRIPPRRKRMEVVAACPVCGSELEYRQKAFKTSVKPVTCDACGTDLLSRYSTDTGFALEKRAEEPIEFKCPNCDTDCVESLDTFPSATVKTTCSACGAEIRVSRTTSGFRVTLLGLPNEKKLSPALLERVAQELPEQPWPKGVHRQVAEKLGISLNLTSIAITELIHQGRFKPQFDGKVLVPEDAESDGAGTDSEEAVTENELRVETESE